MMHNQVSEKKLDLPDHLKKMLDQHPEIEPAVSADGELLLSKINICKLYHISRKRADDIFIFLNKKDPVIKPKNSFNASFYSLLEFDRIFAGKGSDENVDIQLKKLKLKELSLSLEKAYRELVEKEKVVGFFQDVFSIFYQNLIVLKTKYSINDEDFLNFIKNMKAHIAERANYYDLDETE